MRAWVLIASLLCVALMGSGCSPNRAAVSASTSFVSHGLSAVLPAVGESEAKMDALVSAIEARRVAEVRAAREQELAEAKARAAAKALARSARYRSRSRKTAAVTSTARSRVRVPRTGYGTDLEELRRGVAERERMKRELEEQTGITDSQW